LLELIFDKFVQSSKTRTNAGGTGLGLAICRQITELHGGRIQAQQRRERRDVHRHRPAAGTAGRIEKGRGCSMTKAKILAVDDDTMNLDIISATFDGSGVDITYADGGARAVALLDDPSACHDLVVLDRMMPGMDGMEVLRWIKARPGLAHLPVIMQTAVAAPEQVEEGLRAGAHYYLTKPYAPAALRTIEDSDPSKVDSSQPGARHRR
jgi:CheY-like chemotaxis protein